MSNLFDPDKTAADLFEQHGVRVDREFKTVGRIFKIGFALWCVWAVIVLGALCGLGYVAWHFLSKVW
jgi:hypothetical protein